MTKILEILDKILDHVRKNNPYRLVLKGGTSLALHHLNGHRESEDLDFDADISLKGREQDIANYIENILKKMVADKELRGYRISKQGMAATDRYHMNIYLQTHKEMQTKVDLDFVKLPPQIDYDGELGFYTIERMFVGKLLSYSSRREFKDMFDIKHLLKKVDSCILFSAHLRMLKLDLYKLVQ